MMRLAWKEACNSMAIGIGQAKPRFMTRMERYYHGRPPNIRGRHPCDRICDSVEEARLFRLRYRCVLAVVVGAVILEDTLSSRRRAETEWLIQLSEIHVKLVKQRLDMISSSDEAVGLKKQDEKSLLKQDEEKL